MLQKGPIAENVVERGLVTKSPSPLDIIYESSAYCKKTGERNVTRPVLGYVTPVRITTCVTINILHWVVEYETLKSSNLVLLSFYYSGTTMGMM